MKIKSIKFLAPIIILASLLLAPISAAADGASVYLTSSVSTVSSGGTLIVAVYMNGGGNPINAVAINLYYPASQLQYVGLNYSGSPFNISTPSDGGGGGNVSIQNGTISPVSGSALLATVTFHALASSGSASIGVSSSSQLISATTNTAIPFSSSGTSVNFGYVHSSVSSSSSTAAAPPPPAPTPATTISNIKVSDLTPTTATVSWTTNNQADSVVDFGLNSSYGLSNSSSTLTTTHSVQLSSSFLLPETLMHFKVQSTDGNGNVVSSTDKTFQLPGIPLTVIVYSPSGKPLPGAVVFIENSKGVTNNKGQVTLNAGYGNKSITTTYQGVTVTKPISVSSTTKPLTAYQLDLAKQPLNHWMLASIALIVIVIMLLAVDTALFGARILSKITGLEILHRRPLSAKATSSETFLDDTKIVNDPLEDPIAQNEKQEIVNKVEPPLAEHELPEINLDINNTPPEENNFISPREVPTNILSEPSSSNTSDIKPAPPLTIKISDSSDTKKHKVKRKVSKK